MKGHFSGIFTLNIPAKNDCCSEILYSFMGGQNIPQTVETVDGGNLDFHDEVELPADRGNTAHFGVARQFVQKAEGRCAL